MTAELAQMNDADLRLQMNQFGPPLGAAVDLEEWASRMTHAGTIARALAGTPFVPRSLRVMNGGQVDVAATTATVAAALLTGTEVGMAPMAALRSIDVIEGTPALRSMALRALVLRAGHDIWVIESTATRAIVAGRRNGSSHEQQSVWTLDRAKTARLTGKTNWQNHPGAMLVARAAAECARLIAPDVLLGLPYAAEELADGDIADDAEQPGPAAPPAKRTAQRRAKRDDPPPAIPAAALVATVEDEPPLDDEPEPTATQPTEPEPEPDDQAMTTAQTRKMHALFRELGVQDRGERLAFVRDVIDRDIESSTELTRDEASLVIDTLMRALQPTLVEEGR